MKYFLKYLLLFSIVLFLESSIQSQNPAHYIIGAQQFSNTDIYTLLYDDNTDVLYAGTSDGLFAYKQNKFVRFKTISDQKGNSFFNLQQNSKGDIFCSNFSGQIFKLSGNKLELYYQLDETNKNFEYFIDEKDNIAIKSKDEISIIDTQGKRTLLFNLKKYYTKLERGGFNFIITQSKGGEIYISYNDANYFLKIKNGSVSEENNQLKIAKRSLVRYVKLDDKLFGIIENENEILKIKENITLGTTINYREKFHYLNKSEILALDLKKGVRILGLRNDSLIEKSSFFKEKFISTVYQNKSGTLFLGTFGNGVIVIPNKSILKHKYKGLFLGITSSPNNSVFLSTREGKVFKYQNKLELLDEVKANVDNIYYTSINYSFKGIKEQNILYDTYYKNLTGIKTFSNIKDVAVVDSSNIIISGHNRIALYEIDALEGLEKETIIIDMGRASAIEYNQKEDVLYYASNTGVFYQPVFKGTKIDTLRYQQQKIIASDILFYNNQLICSSSKLGILFYEDNKVVEILDYSKGLTTVRIKKILAKGNILYILGKGKMQFYNMKLKRFVFMDLPEGAVTNFCLSNDKIWLMEKHSFYSVNLSSQQKERTIAQLFIDSVTVNDNSINYLNLNTFSYQENKFNFYFDYRDNESKSETSIHYTLKGFYDDWRVIEPTQNIINFQSLPVGEYTFKIKAVYRKQETETFIYSFVIKPPFWQAWWFYFITLLILLLVAFYRVKYVQNKSKLTLNEQRLKTSLLDSELKALRSQMNPHFIFNSLNSIQGLILQQDTDASYDYIVLFADLVRNTLNYSNNDFISISKEIEFLEVYLKLEKLRFGENFAYEIKYTGDKEISVPSLIVQPFIENALLHGLLHKKGNKNLTVTFELTDKLNCIIIDNGVGREKAKEIQERQGSKHESFALNAIKQRLAILSEKSETPATFTTTDLYENEIPSGTKIEVIIPFKSSF